METRRGLGLLRGARQDPDAPQPRGEARRTLRRPTLATVRSPESNLLDDPAVATNLSADGAFVQSSVSPAEGTRFLTELILPTDNRPIRLRARVVRKSDKGVGIRFEEVSARDRSRLRSYSGYYDTDDTIVRIQQSLGDLIPGNLLPFSDRDEVSSILQAASERRAPVQIVTPGKGFRPISGEVMKVEEERTDEILGRAIFSLGSLSSPLPRDARTLYLTFSLPPLHYMCEALVSRSWPELELLLPDRVYISERRSQRRASGASTWIEIVAPHLREEPIRVPVIDMAEGGASIRLPASALWLPGTRLPGISLVSGTARDAIAGATVQYVRRTGDGWLRAGLRFEDGEADRRVLRTQKRSTEGRGIMRSLAYFRGKISRIIQRPAAIAANEVEVVRFKNRRGDTVAGILDATFAPGSGAGSPDVAIVIAPAILKRKEVFGLFSQTLVDNLRRHGLSGVVLRFDASHVVGESTIDSKLEAEGRPYFRWSFGHLRDDMNAALDYLDQRFRPSKRALISLSLSAIPARRVLVERGVDDVDVWVAPFGCPDAQDMVRNYLAGLDLFPDYEKGVAPEAVMIHGRPISSESLYGQALKDKMAYARHAREDLEAIKTPVCWILGKHDHWVTHSRVREMLEAPGGGVREVFELPTGHVLKGGDEAIELFKLVAETILKHAFSIDQPAIDPDFSKFGQKSHAEWARVKRGRLGDSKEFWREHLFGDAGDDGYDIMLDHPGYPRFLRRQVELLDPRPGEDVADLGCGTGNLSLEILRSLTGKAKLNSLTYVDLVPEAVRRTEQKIIDLCAGNPEAEPTHKGIVRDLEVSRLAAVRDFVEGRVWGVEGLVGRVEGLDPQSASAIQASNGKQLHGVLRGRTLSLRQVRHLAPKLTKSQAEVVLDLSQAAAALKSRHQGQGCQHTFSRLFFGDLSKSLRYDLPSSGFDKVGASLLIPYLYDPLAFLAEVYRLLRPGGVLVASSIVPNFDPSKTYLEAASIIKESTGSVAERKLAALRHYGNMVSRLIELEEDGRFHFHGAEALCSLAEEAGFSEARAFPAFGSPPTTMIIRAQK